MNCGQKVLLCRPSHKEALLFFWIVLVFDVGHMAHHPGQHEHERNQNNIDLGWLNLSNRQHLIQVWILEQFHSICEVFVSWCESKQLHFDRSISNTAFIHESESTPIPDSFLNDLLMLFKIKLVRHFSEITDHSEAAGVRRGPRPHRGDDLNPSVPSVLGRLGRPGRRADQLLSGRRQLLESERGGAQESPKWSQAALQASCALHHQPREPHR